MQDMTISDIMNSAFGSAGQRCMAASILIVVGKGKRAEEGSEDLCLMDDRDVEHIFLQAFQLFKHFLRNFTPIHTISHVHNVVPRVSRF